MALTTKMHSQPLGEVYLVIAIKAAQLVVVVYLAITIRTPTAFPTTVEDFSEAQLKMREDYSEITIKTLLVQLVVFSAVKVLAPLQAEVCLAANPTLWAPVRDFLVISKAPVLQQLVDYLAINHRTPQTTAGVYLGKVILTMGYLGK